MIYAHFSPFNSIKHAWSASASGQIGTSLEHDPQPGFRILGLIDCRSGISFGTIGRPVFFLISNAMESLSLQVTILVGNTALLAANESSALFTERN